MKTFRNTLIIAVLTTCLTSVSVFAGKDTRRITDTYAVRTEVSGLLSNSGIAETGLVNILFKVDGSHLRVITVNGENPQLNREVKELLETSMVKLCGITGYYSVQINMNGARPAKEKRKAKTNCTEEKANS